MESHTTADHLKNACSRTLDTSAEMTFHLLEATDLFYECAEKSISAISSRAEYEKNYEGSGVLHPLLILSS